MWLALTAVAVVGLVIFWAKGPNPVWGGATFGFLAGLIAAAVYYFRGEGFSWAVVGKWVVVAVLISLAQELISLALRRRK